MNRRKRNIIKKFLEDDLMRKKNPVIYTLKQDEYDSEAFFAELEATRVKTRSMVILMLSIMGIENPSEILDKALFMMILKE